MKLVKKSARKSLKSKSTRRCASKTCKTFTAHFTCTAHSARTAHSACTVQTAHTAVKMYIRQMPPPPHEKKEKQEKIEKNDTLR